jgi:hypothetical protein
MGQDDRSHWKAEQKKRSERVRTMRRTATGRSRPVSAQDEAETLIMSALDALGCADHDECRNQAGQVIAVLAHEGGTAWSRAVDEVLFRLNLDVLGGKCWPEGWQPADVARVAARVAARELGAEARRVAADLMAAQLRSYAPATIDAVWHDQLAELAARVWWPDDASYITSLTAARRLDRAGAVGTLARLFGLLTQLPVLEALTPPPGSARNSDAERGAGTERGADGADEKLLARVRALLAKAESTTFEAEAETFTAAAQAMMARHSIDQAMLTGPDGQDGQRPGGIRLGVENPYPEAKAVLLQQIAEANRCRTVWSKHLGFTTVLGYRADTAWVELLYTSLLVQATAAMTKAGSKTTAYGGSRTRAFRTSFLESFAVRIGERLRHETQQAESEAAESAGRDLLPVLARRDQAVDDEVRRIFPQLTNTRRASWWAADREGWAAGRTAADLADLARSGAALGSGAGTAE